jgi:hypothetical protein
MMRSCDDSSLGHRLQMHHRATPMCSISRANRMTRPTLRAVLLFLAVLALIALPALCAPAKKDFYDLLVRPSLLRL